MTQQVLRGWDDIAKSLPTATDRFVKDYSAMKDDVESLQLSINNLMETIDSYKPLFGAQTPEGNVVSNNSQVYFDTTNSPTSVAMYFNENVGSDTGWVSVV